jgi:Protein of unknown function (DUF3574)
MTEFKIYLGLKRGTDDIPIEQVNQWIDAVVANKLPSFTITEATGYWNGQKEKTLVITHLFEPWDLSGIIKTVRKLAQSYAANFGQESVLITTAEVNANFIEPEQTV